jgi:hypothetical protein
MQDFFFPDEAWFHLSDFVNSKNYTKKLLNLISI